MKSRVAVLLFLTLFPLTSVWGGNGFFRQLQAFKNNEPTHYPPAVCVSLLRRLDLNRSQDESSLFYLREIYSNLQKTTPRNFRKSNYNDAFSLTTFNDITTHQSLSVMGRLDPLLKLVAVMDPDVKMSTGIIRGRENIQAAANALRGDLEKLDGEIQKLYEERGYQDLNYLRKKMGNLSLVCLSSVLGVAICPNKTLSLLLLAAVGGSGMRILRAGAESLNIYKNRDLEFKNFLTAVTTWTMTDVPNPLFIYNSSMRLSSIGEQYFYQLNKENYEDGMPEVVSNLATDSSYVDKNDDEFPNLVSIERLVALGHENYFDTIAKYYQGNHSRLVYLDNYFYVDSGGEPVWIIGYRSYADKPQSQKPTKKKVSREILRGVSDLPTFLPEGKSF